MEVALPAAAVGGPAVGLPGGGLSHIHKPPLHMHHRPQQQRSWPRGKRQLLRRRFAQSGAALERLSVAAVAERSCRQRHQAEASAVWARHLPLAEREEKRLKVAPLLAAYD